jgi:hypothetical protein
METVIVLVVTHDKPVPDLIAKVSGRAWTIEGVSSVEIVEDNLPWPELHPPEVLDTLINSQLMDECSADRGTNCRAPI